MYHDDIQYNKARFTALAWHQKLRESLPELIKQIADRFGVKAEYEYLSLGSFNCCYRLKELHSIIRFPIFCKSVFRYEKTNDECMVMAYISRHTSIPIPKVLAAESSELGPYMVLSFVDGTRLSDHLKAQSDPGEPIMLQPDINFATLASVYRSMARVLIELSGCEFSRIGAIGQDDSGNWHAKKRPITLNMNQIVSCGNYPPNALPQETFATANAYFTVLAETHITHLRTQRNDAVTDEADCRKKYVARRLFLKIARTFSTTYNHGPFPLYCDDLRPTNVIVDSHLNIRGIIDWEYCYVAPAEFTYCSPWWLLLKHPDDWDDLTTFLREYIPRHDLFIEVLRDEENDMIRRGDISEQKRLSVGMAESLRNGHFWFCLAATSSYGFDDIYWKFIDPLYYGERTSIEDRIRLLSKQEQDELAPFVQLKMQQAEDGELDENWDYYQMFTA
ncbi:hypothetical protein Plec18167_004782 [Paecilomyces lecythidis]|uniref:Aminoglycoside phosphotransferase domain-containing protein n=1 Tax=Paecilomyces lecythidis TaxID=3004212 RepID=A0ABR3XQC9_9EURO